MMSKYNSNLLLELESISMMRITCFINITLPLFLPYLYVVNFKREKFSTKFRMQQAPIYTEGTVGKFTQTSSRFGKLTCTNTDSI